MSEMALTCGSVLLVGDIMRDVIVRPHGDLRAGSDQKADIELRSGGSAANQAVWLVANNVSTRLVARVGRDDLESLSKQFKARSVEPLFAGDPDLPTGTLVSMVAQDGERSFYTDRGANGALCKSDVPSDILENTAMIVLSGYSFFLPRPRAVAQDLMARAKEKNIEVAIDPSSAGFIEDVGVPNFLEWTKGASILFPNSREAELLSGVSSPEQQLRKLGKNYQSVVLTQGGQGVMALDCKGKVVFVKATPVKVVDTTGAGDAFVGGFIAAKLRGLDLRKCLEKGVEQGGIAVTIVGGQPKQGCK